jgi:purine-nucleoside phosphorylase
VTTTPSSGGAFDRVADGARFVRRAIGEPPAIAVVLGSGLSGVAERVENAVFVAYDQIPHWPVPTVAGHPGRLIAGAVAGRPILVLAGRAHLYEGRTPEQVAFGIRVLHALGVRTVILTNAAGGIAPDLVPGDLMLIDDHINLTGSNPLVGPHEARFGTRFPDMSEVYSSRLRQLAAEAAADAGLRVAHGVYVGVSGPSYETPAEIRAFGTLGADAVGMSTVHEAIVARHLGLEVLGLSCITNVAAGRRPQVLTEAEVLAETARARDGVARLLEGTVARL